MGGIFSRDSGEAEGYKEMAKYLHQGMDEMGRQYQDALRLNIPFYEAGLGAMRDYGGALNSMVDPKAFYQRMMEGYQTSPQAKFQAEEALKASNAAASAGGMLGSGAQQKALSEFTQKNIAADQQRWLDNHMGIWDKYLAGKEGMTGRGFGTAGMLGGMSTELGQNKANMLSEIGRVKYGQKVAEANDRGDFWGSLLGLGTTLLTGGLGGGLGGLGGGLMSGLSGMGGGLMSGLGRLGSGLMSGFGGLGSMLTNMFNSSNMPIVPASMVGVPRLVSPSYYQNWPSYRGG